MNTVPISALLEALAALKAAEAFFDKANGQGVLWCDTMQARVRLEYHVDLFLSDKSMEVQP